MLSRLRLFHFLLLGIFALLGALFALVPSSSVVYAEDKNTWQCWHTGPKESSDFFTNDSLERGGWGPEYAFALEPGDWESLESQDYRIVEPALAYKQFAGTDPVFATFSPMSSLPEYVDNAFYFDFSNPSDGEFERGCRDSLLLERLRAQLLGTACPGGGAFELKGVDPPNALNVGAALTPWSHNNSHEVRRELLNQRSVAVESRDRVHTFNASWRNPDQPGGGAQWDQAAFLHDMMALMADLNVSSRVTAQEGNRRFSATATVPTITIQSSTTLTCGAGYPTANSCSSTTTTTSAPDSVNVHWQGVEQNNGEVFHVSHTAQDTPAERVVLVDYTAREDDPLLDVVRVEEVYPHRQFGVSELHERLQWARPGYSFLGQRSADSGDELFVDITLDPVHRGDYPWNYGDTFPHSVMVRAFGPDPWTMEAHQTTRWRFRPTSTGSDIPNNGYRQPHMSLATFNANAADPVLKDPALSLIRWPVSFEDLAWYLYEIPGTRTRDTGEWLPVVDQSGGSGLVDSGFSSSGDTQPVYYDCKYDGALYTREGISCSYRGLGDSRFYPFEHTNSSGGPRFNSLLLVHAGVAQAADAQSNETRRLNRFSFSVRDFEPFADKGVSQGNVNALRRYGVPAESGKKERYLAHWPCVDYGHDPNAAAPFPNSCRPVRSEPTVGAPGFVGDSHDLNPNQPYLMVIAFYESVNPYEETDSVRELEVRYSDERRNRTFSVPERRVRRVICRMLVLPTGIQPATDEGNPLVEGMKNAFKSGFQTLGDVTSGALDFASGVITGFLSNMVGGFLEGVLQGPSDASRLGQRVACVGMDQLGNATDPAGGAYKPGVDVVGGTVVVNQAQQSRNEGFQGCQTVTVHEPESCGVAAGTVVEEDCVIIPSLEVELTGATFVDLAGDTSNYTAQTAGRFDVLDATLPNVFPVDFGFIEGIVLTQTGLAKTDSSAAGAEAPVKTRPLPFNQVPGSAPTGLDTGFSATPYNSGLTRVRLDWAPRWEDEVTSRDLDGISGYHIRFVPDPKIYPLTDGSTIDFHVPRFLETTYGSTQVNQYPVDHIYFGGMGIDGGLGYATEFHDESHPLFRVEDYPYPTPIVESDSFVVAPVGTVESRAEFDRLATFVDNLPLGPGLVHEFEIRAYVGVLGRGADRLDYGPFAKFVVNGDEAICHSERGADRGLEDLRLLLLYPACFDPPDPDDLRLYVPVLAGVEEVVRQVSLLNLTGTQTCSDFFTATPALLTWDNAIVRAGWSLMWIFAGAVMFVLIVWQGLRMTVDTWLDPRPAAGFREFVPKALLALILAIGSLYICQFVLILAADLTCMVAQATGITMWGFWGQTFSSYFNSMGDMIWDTARMFGAFEIGKGLINTLKYFFIMFILNVIFISWLLIIAFMFFKIVWTMLTRLALLAVLIVFSPLAFVMMASENTQHWTSKWITMFLGTTFQQVVVVMILYIGLHFMEGFVDSTEGVPLTKFLISTFLVMAILMLADKAPSLINPGSKGLFDGLGSMLKMAGMAGVAAAAVIFPPIAGAVMAGVGAMAAGGGAAAAGSVAAGTVGGAAATGAAATGAVAGAGSTGAAAAAAAPRAGGILGNLSSLRGTRFFTGSSRAGSMTQGTAPSSGSGPSFGQRIGAGARAAGSQLRSGFSPQAMGRRFRLAQDFNRNMDSLFSGRSLTGGGRPGVWEGERRSQAGEEAAEQEQEHRQQMLQQMQTLNQSLSGGSRRMGRGRRP